MTGADLEPHLLLHRSTVGSDCTDTNTAFQARCLAEHITHPTVCQTTVSWVLPVYACKQSPGARPPCRCIMSQEYFISLVNVTGRLHPAPPTPGPDPSTEGQCGWTWGLFTTKSLVCQALCPVRREAEQLLLWPPRTHTVGRKPPKPREEASE